MDRIKRLKWVLFTALLLVNVASGLTALATSFTGLVWPRVLLAFFSSIVDPTLFRLLAFYFPSAKRGAASGVLFVAIYIGVAAGSLTLLLAQAVGWRLCFLLTALTCAIITSGFCLLLTNQPIETYRNPEIMLEPRSTLKDVQALWHNRTLVVTIAALFLRYLATFATSFFLVPYLSWQFPEYTSQLSVMYFGLILIAAASLIVAGQFTDKRAATQPWWRPLLCSIVSIACGPFILVLFLADNFWLAMGCLFPLYLYGEAYLSVSFAMMISVTTPHVRALRKISLRNRLDAADILLCRGPCDPISRLPGLLADESPLWSPSYLLSGLLRQRISLSPACAMVSSRS